MVRQVATRSQRRTEKRQAVVLLALVLTVALVSFTLGVLVGRSSSKSAVAVVEPLPRLPVAPPVPAPPPTEAPLGERPAEGLTFYDSLPKGEQTPLGSGINLPPARESAAVAAVDPGEPAKPAGTADGTTGTKGTDAEAPSPAKTAVPAPVPATKPAAKAVSAVAPAPAAAGGYMVQAAAFRRSEDARALQAKLGKKGYAVFTEEAQLGEKGVWFRVYVGPYATAGAADAAVSRLMAEEKLTALVRKR